MFRILKFDDDFVYLSHPDGRLKKIDRTLFDFDIKLGDRIDVYQDGDLTVVTPAEVQTDLSLEGDKSVKSHLLQGILDLFLETLNIHNNHLGDLKKIFTQLLITLFMAWSLLGVHTVGRRLVNPHFLEDGCNHSPLEYQSDLVDSLAPHLYRRCH